MINNTIGFTSVDFPYLCVCIKKTSVQPEIYSAAVHHCSFPLPKYSQSLVFSLGLHNHTPYQGSVGFHPIRFCFALQIRNCALRCANANLNSKSRSSNSVYLVLSVFFTFITHAFQRVNLAFIAHSLISFATANGLRSGRLACQALLELKFKFALVTHQIVKIKLVSNSEN